jgi:hypothetical protein
MYKSNISLESAIALDTMLCGRINRAVGDAFIKKVRCLRPNRQCGWVDKGSVQRLHGV